MSNTSGTIHTTSPTTNAFTARRALGCVCGGMTASSRSATSASSPSAGAGVEPSSPAAPISPAPRMITGNVRWNTKIARNEAPATTTIARVRSAFLPIRITACATMPTTAACSPRNNPSTTATSPCAA